MSYKIQTIDYHERALRVSCEAESRRMQEGTWIDDTALSSWGAQNMVSFHKLAIEMLELGKGSPAHYFTVLYEGDRKVDAKIINTDYGTCWILSEPEAQTFGRKFIPCGRRSTIQKRLKLSEKQELLPAKYYVGSHCSFVGGVVSFYPIRAD